MPRLIYRFSAFSIFSVTYIGKDSYTYGSSDVADTANASTSSAFQAL